MRSRPQRYPPIRPSRRTTRSGGSKAADVSIPDTNTADLRRLLPNDLRERIALEHPQFAHDFTRQRKLSLAHALRTAGEDEIHVEDAFTAFYAARNRIEFYPDAVLALERLTARWPEVAQTNGNSDLARNGIAHHIRACVTARIPQFGSRIDLKAL